VGVGVGIGVGIGVGVGVGAGVKVGSGGSVGSGSSANVDELSERAAAAGATVLSRWMYATVGARLIASMPAAFANPAALSISASPATGVP
jgi:hypothetical protein